MAIAVSGGIVRVRRRVGLDTSLHSGRSVWVPPRSRAMRDVIKFMGSVFWGMVIFWLLVECGVFDRARELMR